VEVPELAFRKFKLFLFEIPLTVFVKVLFFFGLDAGLEQA
jgi:hypothetical protein